MQKQGGYLPYSWLASLVCLQKLTTCQRWNRGAPLFNWDSRITTSKLRWDALQILHLVVLQHKIPILGSRLNSGNLGEVGVGAGVGCSNRGTHYELQWHPHPAINIQWLGLENVLPSNSRIWYARPLLSHLELWNQNDNTSKCTLLSKAP